MNFKEYLNFLHPRISDEHGQKLMLYLAFIIRFCKKNNISPDRSMPKESMLPFLFQQYGPHELTADARAFDAVLPWSVIKKDSELLGGIDYLLYTALPREDATPMWLLEQTDAILDCGSLTADFVMTPPCIRTLTARLASQHTYKNIEALYCGISALGFEVFNRMSQKSDISFSGEDPDPFLCSLSRLFLYLCNVSDAQVNERSIVFDTKSSDTVPKPTVFIADLPLAGHRLIPVAPNSEFLRGSRCSVYPDWYVMSSVLDRMHDADRAFFIEAKGPLVRSKEQFLRKKLVERNWLEAVIRLPAGLYSNHSLPMNLMICSKRRPDDRKSGVLFADLSEFAQLDPVNCRTRILSDGAIDRMQDVYSRFEADNTFSRIVSNEIIQQNNYSLHPPLYLTDTQLSSDQLRLKDVARLTRGLLTTDVTANEYFTERFLLNVRDIQNGDIQLEKAEKLDCINRNWDRKFLVSEDDIIITSKGSALKIAIAPPDMPPCYISGNLTVIRVDKSKYDPYVLYEYLSSDEGLEALTLIQTGTTIRILGVGNLENLFIPKYSIEGMREVGAALKNATLQYKRSIQALERSFSMQKSFLLEEINLKR